MVVGQMAIHRHYVLVLSALLASQQIVLVVAKKNCMFRMVGCLYGTSQQEQNEFHAAADLPAYSTRGSYCCAGVTAQNLLSSPPCIHQRTRSESADIFALLHCDRANFFLKYN